MPLCIFCIFLIKYVVCQVFSHFILFFFYFLDTVLWRTIAFSFDEVWFFFCWWWCLICFRVEETFRVCFNRLESESAECIDPQRRFMRRRDVTERLASSMTGCLYTVAAGSWPVALTQAHLESPRTGDANDAILRMRPMTRDPRGCCCKSC